MTGSVPIGFAQALWLLLRLQVIRFGRQMIGGFRFFRPKPAAPKRAATRGKLRRNWLIGGLVALSTCFAFVNLGYQTLSNIEQSMGSVPVSVSQPRPAKATKTTRRTPLPAAAGFTQALNVLKGTILITCLFLFAAMLLAISNGELTRPDWDLEWLATLPLPLSTLLSARIFARSISSPMGLSALLPFLSVVAWKSGYGYTAPLMGLAATIPLLVIAATAQTICDTGLRLRLGPSQLRNFQALVAIGAVAALYLAISPGMPSKNGLVLGWAYTLPAWAFWTPPGLAIQAITSTAPLWTAQAFGLLLAEALLLAALGVLLLNYQLRSGVVAAGVRESGRREAVRKAKGGPASRVLLTPIQARELRLLGRDRNFLVQTMVMPVVLVGAQIFLNGSGAALFSGLNQHPEHIAALAFGTAAYALMFSAFQTLNAEGQALWILYCVPQTLASVLRQKAALWAVVCLIYPLAIFGAAIAVSGAVSLQLLGVAALVLLGIPVFATIATSLGVFACDPLSQNVQRRVKVSYTYLYLLLSSFYIYSVYANSFWQRLSLLILTALLALALWQKARDQLPFLLDPAASPPARVSVSDGLIAALLFFVLQSVVMIFRSLAVETLTGFDLLIAFSIAGAATFAIMRLTFWRLHSEGVPRTFGPGTPAALLWGVLGGLAAAAVALLYLKLLPLMSLFQQAGETAALGQEDKLLIAILAICAAPIFEEFIFRGLIFGGLRRSMGLAASVLGSAAIFAIVHPPPSVIPVFGLGIATALIYSRTRLLIGPMAAHAAYNAIVVGYQLLP
jgi:membrane protease YdiL (CAAX protease family)